jgi:hypothetical protein
MAKKPVKLTPALQEEICLAISTSTLSIKKLCKQNPHWPTAKHIFARRVKDPLFGDQYARAKCEQIEAFIDEMLEIADDGSNDTYVNDDGKSVTDHDVLGRSRLRIDLRKWYASKLAPKLYGDNKGKDEDKSPHEKYVEELKGLE